MKRHFWLSHGMPPIVLAAAACVSSASGLDLALIDGLYAPGNGWPLTGHPIAVQLLHHLAQDLLRFIGLGALILWLAAHRWPVPRHWQRVAGFTFLSLALCSAMVGLLKLGSSISCPWSLTHFGGTRPYVGLFDPSPAGSPMGRCFPGGHSAGGFALFGVYFALRDDRPRAARTALKAAVLIGSLFALVQWLRGAHFPSHDLASAALCWLISLGIYLASTQPISIRDRHRPATRRPVSGRPPNCGAHGRSPDRVPRG